MRGQNVLGAKRPGQKSQGAKCPGPKCLGAKRPRYKTSRWLGGGGEGEAW